MDWNDVRYFLALARLGSVRAAAAALGKAPRVWLLTKAGLADDLRRAGFVEPQWPEVGASPSIAFLVGKRP